jgi:hypothetical protein
MGHVPVGIRSGRSPTLPSMAHGATESLNRMLFVQRMVSERLRVATVTRVIHSEMAGRAAVHAVEVREKNLADLDRYSFGQRTLLRCGCAPELRLNILALVILPLALLISIVCEYDQTADQKANFAGRATVSLLLIGEMDTRKCDRAPTIDCQFSTLPCVRATPLATERSQIILLAIEGDD